MLANPIIDRIRQLRLYGFIKALEEQNSSKSYEEMTFNDRLSFLLDRELLERENKALSTRIGRARFKQKACVENVTPGVGRGIDKTILRQLSTCEWIKQKRNIIVTGPSGAGKSYLASALAHKACLMGYTARYFRASNLLIELESARVEGRYRKLITQWAKINVLIIDDFCLSALNETEEKDIFELVEERQKQSSTIITSQNPVSTWHGLMPNPAIADAILDRLIYAAERIELKGESRRKEEANHAAIDNKA